MITISKRIIICACLCACMTISKAGSIYSAGTGTGAGYEFYNHIPLSTEHNIDPQDDIDAHAIIDGKMSEEILASILAYREKNRRISIIQKISVYDGGKEFIADDYLPQNITNTPFKDLIYGLAKDENLVLGGYLNNFFDQKDETWIIIAMVLTKDMHQMIDTYDIYQKPKTFKNERKKQRHPFENMLRVWVRDNREPNESCDPDHTTILKDAKALQNEYDNGGNAFYGDGWQEARDQLERILMKKSIRYARAVIKEFEKANGNKPMETVITDCIKSYSLNHDLVDAYASLARYIKDRHQYIADIIRQYSDGKDRWAAWIMCLAVTSPQEWPLIDKAFTKDHKNDPLSKFVMQKLADNKIMAEMIAVLIDPSFKPTTFTKKPVQGGVEGTSTPGPSSAPPPVSPTTVSSSP